MRQQPQIRRVGFTRGFRWLVASGELMGRGGGGMLAVSGLLAVFLLLQVIPMIGPAVLTLITPLLTAGLLIAFHRITRGEPLRANTLLAAWQDPGARRPLLVLGIWLMLGSLAAILSLGAWLAPQLDMSELEQAMASNPEAVLALLQGTNLLGGIAIAGIILTVVLAALYFAVPLTGFAHWPATVAGLFSLRAVVVNWAAFLGLGAGLLVVGVAVLILFLIVAMILVLALGTAAQWFTQVLGILVGLFLQVLMAGAQYVAFREVFEWPQVDDPTPDAPESGPDEPGRQLEM